MLGITLRECVTDFQWNDDRRGIWFRLYFGQATGRNSMIVSLQNRQQREGIRNVDDKSASTTLLGIFFQAKVFKNTLSRRSAIFAQRKLWNLVLQTRSVPCN